MQHCRSWGLNLQKEEPYTRLHPVWTFTQALRDRSFTADVRRAPVLAEWTNHVRRVTAGVFRRGPPLPAAAAQSPHSLLGLANTTANQHAPA